MQPISSSNPDPWQRFFARLVDALIIWHLPGALYVPIRIFLNIDFPPLTIPATVSWFTIAVEWVSFAAAFYLIEAACLFRFHTTIGKKWFGITVRAKPGVEETFQRYLYRTWRVFFEGHALWLPVLAFFAAWRAKTIMEVEGEAPWDKQQELIVENVPVSSLRLAIFPAYWVFTAWLGFAAMQYDQRHHGPITRQFEAFRKTMPQQMPSGPRRQEHAPIEDWTRR